MIQSEVRRGIAHTWGKRLRDMSSNGLLGVLCASALAPVLATAVGAGALVVAGVGVLGSVGANVLTEVVIKTVEGVRRGGRHASPDEVEGEIAAAIERALGAGDPRAKQLRQEVAAVLRETGTVAAAMQAAVQVADPAWQQELTRALAAISADFDEFGFVLAELQATAGTILEELRRQESERRADRTRGHESAVQLRLIREELAVLERRSRRPGARSGEDEPPAVVWDGCPYRGLWPFEESHAAVFYGREQLTAELVTTLSSRLTGLGMLIVTGASGAGKSSLLRAGLLPALARGSLVDGSADWPRIVLTPTAAPLDELATHLAALGGMEVTQVRRGLAEAPGRAHLTARQALLAAGEGRRLVLVVDQFEEIFTLGGDDPAGAPQRQGFVEALHAMACVPSGSHGEPAAVVVIGVRGDFWDRCAAHPQLVEALEAGPFLVGPMSEPELRQAIAGPAVAAGLRLEGGLTELVLGELRGGAGAPGAGDLPLLSQAMLGTWEHRTPDGLLTARGYALSGGIGQAVQASAEAAYGALTDRQRTLARTIFRRLTVVARDGRLARSRIDRTALSTVETRPDVDAILEAFAARRLVVLHDHTVEVAHDALLSAWPRLRAWLEGDLADLALYSQLIDDTAVWAAKGRDSSFLYRGVKLATVVEAAKRWRAAPDRFPPPTQAAARFLAAGRRQRRARALAWRAAVSAIVALMLVASVAAVFLQRRTEELARQLRVNSAQLLVAQARERNRADPVTALLMTVAAYRTSPDPSVLANVAGEYLRYRSASRVLAADIGDIRQVAAGADGRVAAALGARGRIALWRLDREPAGPVYLGSGITSMALSQDGGLVAGSDSTGRIDLWSEGGGEAGTNLRPAGQQGTGAQLRFDPTGRRLLAEPGGGSIEVWDVEQRRQVPLPDGLRLPDRSTSPVYRFGPRGESVVVASNGGLTLWSLADGRSTLVSPLTLSTYASVSGDGLTALVCANKVYVRWQLDPPKERDRHPAPGGVCSTTEVNPAGTVALTETTTESLSPNAGDYPRRLVSLRDLQNANTAKAVIPLPNALAQTPIATTPQGIRLFYSAGGTVGFVDVAHTDFTPLNTALAEVRGPRVFDHNLSLAVLSADLGKPWLRLWDIDGGRQLAESPPEEQRDQTLFGFLNEGRFLLTLDENWEHLVVREVPSLRVTARMPLPVAPGVTRATNAQITSPFNVICATDAGRAGVIAAFFGGLITRYDLATGKQIGQPIQPWRSREELDRLARSQGCPIRPGSSEMALAVAGGTVQLWNMDSGELASTLDPAELAAIADYRFIDGRLLAILDREGKLQVWDVQRRVPMGPAQRVSDPGSRRIVGFPSPGRVVIEDIDRIILWDLDRHAALATMAIGSSGSSLSPDGAVLRTSERNLDRIPLDPARWVERLCRVLGRDITGAERAALPPGIAAGPVCPV